MLGHDALQQRALPQKIANDSPATLDLSWLELFVTHIPHVYANFTSLTVSVCHRASGLSSHLLALRGRTTTGVHLQGLKPCSCHIGGGWAVSAGGLPRVSHLGRRKAGTGGLLAFPGAVPRSRGPGSTGWTFQSILLHLRLAAQGAQHLGALAGLESPASGRGAVRALQPCRRIRRKRRQPPLIPFAAFHKFVAQSPSPHRPD